MIETIHNPIPLRGMLGRSLKWPVYFEPRRQIHIANIQLAQLSPIELTLHYCHAIPDSLYLMCYQMTPDDEQNVG